MGHDVSGQTALAVTTVTVTVDVGALNLWGPSRGPEGGGGTVTVRRSCLNYGAE